MAAPIAVALIIGWATLSAFTLLAPAIAVFILGVTIANALEPVTFYFCRWMSRNKAATVSFIGLLLAIGLAFTLIAAPVTGEINRFTEQMPQMRDRLQEKIAGSALLKALWDRLQTAGPQVAQSAARFLAPVTEGFVTAILVLFFAFYWLLEMPKIRRYIDSLFPPHQAKHISEIRDEMGRAMGSFVRATLLAAIATGLLTYIGLKIAGIDFALPLAGLVFLGEFVPFLGTLVAASVGLLYALTQSTDQFLYALIVYAIVQQAEGQIITPNIMKREMDLPQWLVLLAIFAGGALGGLAGVIVSVPLTAALVVFVDRVLAPAFRRWTGAE